MRVIIQNLQIRTWWQVPRRAGEPDLDRSVSFLELFYDLVYVVLIAQLAHGLSHHLDWTGLWQFGFLYIIVWWSWFNGTTYHDIHGNNDIRTRVFTFVQMMFVIGMAIFAPSALSSGYQEFAVAYGAFQVILLVLWWRTGVHDPEHRPLAEPFVIVSAISAILFAASVLVPASTAIWMWVIAQGSAVIVPLFIFGIGSRKEATREQINLISNVRPSLVERMGLFTIIVLGEVIVGIVNGVATHNDVGWEVRVVGTLAAMLGFVLWVHYFDFISHKLPKPKVGYVTAWMYLHLPLTMAIVIIGAVLFTIIEHVGHTSSDLALPLLGMGVAGFLLMQVVLMKTLRKKPISPYSIGLSVLAAGIIVPITMVNLSVPLTMLLIVGVLVVPVVVEFAIRIVGSHGAVAVD